MTAFGMIVYILAYALVFAYWIWNWGYRQGTTGQSIGKSVMKFKVISEKTGQPIGFGLSIVRQIAHIVDAFDLLHRLPVPTVGRQDGRHSPTRSCRRSVCLQNRWRSTAAVATAVTRLIGRR